ncbi:transposase family protein, partial [Mycobacterium tuberculosis]|uniref:transposase family protein n=1 Tax=Mycobacterium tuberculosis TaxID=1773 RepID=UPI001BACB513
MAQDLLALHGGLLRAVSFTEAIAQVRARARTTTRLRDQIGAAIGDAGRAVAEVAAAHRVSWPTAHRAFSPTPRCYWASRSPPRCWASTSPAAVSPAGSTAPRPAAGC